MLFLRYINVYPYKKYKYSLYKFSPSHVHFDLCTFDADASSCWMTFEGMVKLFCLAPAPPPKPPTPPPRERMGPPEMVSWEGVVLDAVDKVGVATGRVFRGAAMA